NSEPRRFRARSTRFPIVPEILCCGSQTPGDYFAGQSLLVGECRALRKSASARAINSWRPSAGAASARPNVIEWSGSAAASAAAIFSKRALASRSPRFDIAQSSSVAAVAHDHIVWADIRAKGLAEVPQQ